MFENINWCQLLPWMLIGAAILGGLIGWFLRKIKMQPMLLALNGDLSKSKKEYSDLDINYGALQTEKSEVDKYNLQLQAELGDLKSKLEILCSDKDADRIIDIIQKKSVHLLDALMRWNEVSAISKQMAEGSCYQTLKYEHFLAGRE
mgnify:CR=1 FL=1